MLSKILTEFLAQLQTVLVLTAANDLQLAKVFSPDGRPPPASGQTFVALHQLRDSWMPGPDGDRTEAFTEIFKIGITVSQRTGYVPEDKFYDEIWPGMESLIIKIQKQLSKNRWTIFTNINTAIGGTDNLLAIPYHWLGNVGPTERDWKWFSREPPPGPQVPQFPMGYSYLIQFGDFQRTQHRTTLYT